MLVSTTVIEDFVNAFEWQQSSSYRLLQIVHSLLVEWLLKPGSHTVFVDTESASGFVPHPVPLESGHGALIEMWQEEVGRLFAVHKRSCPHGFCIAVACDSAFAGEPKGRYQPPVPDEKFPLIGPTELDDLIDIDDWELPADIHRIPISFSDAKKNLRVLQGTVSRIAEGSHFKVKFPNAERSWPLDVNTDPIPDRFIGQLPALTNYPEGVVRYALLYGKFPPKRSRIPHM